MSAERPAWVYLVECADGTLYAGWCYSVEARVAQHNAGRASRYTRARLPVALRWCEAHPTRRAAMQRELALKGMSRPQKLALIAADAPLAPPSPQPPETHHGWD